MTFFPLSRQGLSRRILAFFTALLLSTGLWSCAADTNAPDDVASETALEEQVLEIIRNNPEVILEAVQKYQEEQQQAQQAEQQRVVQEFQQTMTSDPKAVIGESPVMGSAAFEVVLLEFSDFECPFCSRAHSTLKTFMDKHSDTVTLSYKHFPLQQIHPQATPAAQASWAAQQQDKFWEYHDRLFANQKRLGDALYQEIARDLGLDLDKFNADRAADAAQLAIQKDLDIAQQLQLNGTPFFVLASTTTGNMETLSGALSLEQFEAQLAKVTTPN